MVRGRGGGRGGGGGLNRWWSSSARRGGGTRGGGSARRSSGAGGSGGRHGEGVTGRSATRRRWRKGLLQWGGRCSECRGCVPSHAIVRSSGVSIKGGGVAGSGSLAGCRRLVVTTCRGLSGQEGMGRLWTSQSGHTQSRGLSLPQLPEPVECPQSRSTDVSLESKSPQWLCTFTFHWSSLRSQLSQWLCESDGRLHRR